MNRYEKRRKAIDEEIRKHVDGFQSIYKTAEGEDRDPTQDERLDVESHLKAIETLKSEKVDVEANIKTLQDVEDTGRKLGPSTGVSVGSEPQDPERLFQQMGQVGQRMKSLGEQFVQSDQYQKSVNAIRDASGRLPSNFTTGPVSMDLKGTLLEGAGAPGSGTGGGLLPVPQVVPGVVETLFRKLTVADLLLSGETTTNTIRYVVEGTATSGAAGVAEAGTKPESTLALSTVDEPVKKIATFLPVADEMLEDAAAVQSYINGRLTLFVQLEEERQLLRGTSGGSEVQGILGSRGVPIYAGGTAVGDKPRQLFAALNGLRGSAFLEPEWIIMHPTDYEAVRTIKDTSGQYLGGGPFLGPYGGPQGPVPASGQVSGPVDMIWNKPTHVTAAIGGAGTALIGVSSAAQVWRRGGITVEATNSHASFFQLNLVAIRAEERLGLAVYRPTGFVEVRLS